MLSIIRDNARSGGGEGAHVLLGGGGLAFLGLESSKEEEVGESPEQAGRGSSSATCSSHNDISLFFFGNLSTSEREKISRPWKCIFEPSHVV